MRSYKLPAKAEREIVASCLAKLNAIGYVVAENRTSKICVMYLNTPTSRKGTSSACSIFSKMPSTAVVTNEEQTMRIDMMVPASSSVFFAPIRLMIHGEQNIISALHSSPAVVT